MNGEHIQRTIREYPDGVINVASNGRIGRYIFFPKKIMDHYKQDMPDELTILDLGCGAAADHPLLYDFFDRKGIKLNLIGLDVNEEMFSLVKNGQVTYPLEIDLNVDSDEKISIEKGMMSYEFRNDAFFPRSINEYFIQHYESNEDDSHLVHIDQQINRANGRWEMKKSCRDSLVLLKADAVQIPLLTDSIDIVISENFIFGGYGPVFKRINAEIDRVLKPEGLYLGDRRQPNN